MPEQVDKAAQFLARHSTQQPLLLPNPWDEGSARLLASLGFEALATTSGGFAAALGRRDGQVTRDEALAHAASIVATTDLPVSADLENCFADSPADVAQTIELAIGAGLAGGSVEDFTRDPAQPLYEIGLAAERVAAAAEIAHAGPVHFVLTARAENFLRGKPDLDDTIGRLQAYQEAGADVLFAPGLHTLEQVDQVIAAVDRPVNVVVDPRLPSVADLAEAGVSRISTGTALAFRSLAALVQAASEFRDAGTYEFVGEARAAAKTIYPTLRG